MTSRCHPALAAERRRSLRMAAPLIGAQMLHIGNGLVDTLVAAQIGREELAAGGIGATIWFIVMLSGLGLMAGLSPTMARFIGQSQQREVGKTYRQGLWLALVLGCLGVWLMHALNRSLDGWGFDASLLPPMHDYIGAAMWSIPAAIILLAPRNLCEATGRTRPVLIVQAMGLLINIVGDLGLGLGYFGLPALELAGIGWSTTIVNVMVCVVLLWLVRGKGFRRYAVYSEFDKPDPARLKTLLVLSVPICITLLFEAGLFSATAIQMGMLGAVEASAHNIAIGVTAFAYMLPLGLGFALTARVGVAFGRRYPHAIRLRVANGVILTLIMALSSSLLLFLFREPIARFYTDDEAVIRLTSQLLLMAVVFQISDDFQATLIAMLRGLHDTRMPMLINAVSYWVAGFGVGYVSTHQWGLGPYGLWLGLIVGLTVSSLLLGWRLHWRLRQVI